MKPLSVAARSPGSLGRRLSPVKWEQLTRVLIIAMVVAAPILWIMRFDGIPVLTFCLGLAVFYLSTIPLAVWVRSGKTIIPMPELICLFYGIYTGFGAMTQPNTIVISSRLLTIEWQYVNKAVLLSGIGLLVLIATLSVLRRLTPATGFYIDLRIAPSRQIFAIGGLAVVALAIKAFAREGWLPIGGHVQLGERMLLCSVALAALLYYRFGDRGVSVRSGLVVLLAYVSLVGLSSGMLEAAVLPLLTVFIIRTAARKHFPALLLTAAVCLLFLLNAVKTDYRNRAMRGEGGESYREQLELWRTAFKTYDYRSFIRPDPNAEGTSGLRVSLARFSIVSRAAWVCANTPDRIPFLMGESYKPFLYAPIPRVIWPDKPVISDVLTHIDRTYGFVETEANAAFGIGYLGEGYANFGVWGVIAVMLFQGVSLHFLSNLLNRPSSEGGAAIFTVLLVGMLNGIGSSLIITYGSLLQMLVVCIIVLHLARSIGAPPSYDARVAPASSVRRSR